MRNIQRLTILVLAIAGLVGGATGVPLRPAHSEVVQGTVRMYEALPAGGAKPFVTWYTGDFLQAAMADHAKRAK